MKWYYIVGPEGQTYLIRADSPASAKTRAYTFIQQKWSQFPQGSREANSFAQWAANYGTNADIREFDEEMGNQYAKQMPGNVLGGTGTGTDGSTSGSGSTRKEGDVTTPGWTWRMVDGKLVEVKDPDPSGNTFTDEGDDLFSAYLRGMNRRGISQFGSLGERNLAQYNPYRQAFNAKLDLGEYGNEIAQRGTDAPYFEEYAASGVNPYADLRRAFNAYRTQSVGPANDLGTAREYVAPQDASQFSQAMGTFQGALRSRLGSYAGQRVGRRADMIADEYNALSEQQRGVTNFLQYLQNRLGLSGVNF